MCVPAVAGLMSGSISSITTGLGIMSSIAQVVGQGRAIAAQGRQLAAQTSRAYTENAFRRSQAQRAALEEGYASSREMDHAVGRARVRNTTLGIGGLTAQDLVTQEVQAGSYNIAGSLETARDATAAEVISNRGTYAESTERRAALASNAPSAFGSLLSIATGGLQGYLLGDQIDVARGVQR